MYDKLIETIESIQARAKVANREGSNIEEMGLSLNRRAKAVFSTLTTKEQEVLREKFGVEL